MIKSYSKQEMLERWKRAYGLVASPGLSGLSDRSALDELLLDEIDLWYDRLLLDADPGLLPRADVSAGAETMWLTSNSAEVRFPDRGVRPVRLRMKGWTHDVTLFEAPSSLRAQMQTLQWARATPRTPVAILFPGRLEAHGFDCTAPEAGADCAASGTDADCVAPGTADLRDAECRPVIELLEMVVRPADGTYIIDTSLLPRRR